MTTAEAGRRGPKWSAARIAVVLSALALLTAGPAACGGGDGAGAAASGNAAAGKFDPPPIQTHVDAAVRKACDASSPTIDRIKKDRVLFWAIGVSPPFGFKLERGMWAGVEAQNAAELATILGVRFDIAEYSYDVLPEALVTGQADIVGAELFVTDERKKLIDFSRPYYQSGQLFYVLKDSPYQTISGLDKPDVRFDIAEYSYDVLPEVLVTGQADIVGAELFVTDERKKLIDFSTPYYQSGQLFYVLEGSPIRRSTT